MCEQTCYFGAIQSRTEGKFERQSSDNVKPQSLNSFNHKSLLISSKAITEHHFIFFNASSTSASPASTSPQSIEDKLQMETLPPTPWIQPYSFKNVLIILIDRKNAVYRLQQIHNRVKFILKNYK